MAEVTSFKELTSSIVGKTQGSWHCDAKLGSGSFGIIHIWSNIKDDLVEKITTKQLNVPYVDEVKFKQVSSCQHFDRKTSISLKILMGFLTM